MKTSIPFHATVSAALLVAGVAFGGAARAQSTEAAPAGSGGARTLTLAPGLSFTNDSSSNFPIRGENLEDGKIAADRPTAIFSGTSHCWNTNREAERFVALYAKAKDAARFLVIDLDHVSAEQKPLVSKFYRGSIPTLAFLDSSGRAIYNDAGETSGLRGDTSRLDELLEKAKKAGGR